MTDRATPELMTREEYLAHWAQLHGGYDVSGAPGSAGASVVGFVRGWLSIAYVCARPLARARVSPDLLTGLGLLVSVGLVGLAAAGRAWPLLALIVVPASALADSLDGAVAVMTNRSTRFGFVLDSVVDRISDTLYVVALWLLGAPVGVCVVAGTLMGLHEYLRARALAAGMSDIGAVTVWERPTRVVVTTIFVVLCGLAFLVGGQNLWQSPGFWASMAAWAWIGLGIVGVGQLVIAVRSALGRD